LGIGNWGLEIGPNHQSPITNPQSPIFCKKIKILIYKRYNKTKLIKN